MANEPSSGSVENGAAFNCFLNLFISSKSASVSRDCSVEPRLKETELLVPQTVFVGE